MEPRKHQDAESTRSAKRKTTSPVLSWPGTAVRRGRRAGHVRKGRPGTWEVSSSPPSRGGAGAAIEVVRVLGESPGLGGAKTGEAVVALSEGDEVTRNGGREVGVG